MRTSQSSGAPTVRYCGNLGHKADDESTLIYMRARYYEPTSGRFINEDANGQGANWLVYCGNDPISRADQTGRSWEIAQLLQNAWNLFSNSPWGSGTVDVRTKLLQIVRQLEDVSRQAQAEGEELMSEADVDEEVASCMGSGSEMQQKIAEIKQGIGSMNLASGVAAQLSIGVIKIMLVLLQTQEGDNPCGDFFDN